MSRTACTRSNQTRAIDPSTGQSKPVLCSASGGVSRCGADVSSGRCAAPAAALGAFQRPVIGGPASGQRRLCPCRRTWHRPYRRPYHGPSQRPFLAPRFDGFSLAARRASRYFLMVALGTSLCLAQTMPNTGAAGLLQPGTGQSCLGRRRTGVAPRNAANLGGRPRRLGRAPPPTAAITICRARLVASASTAETNRPTKSSTRERMLDSGIADVLGIFDPTGGWFFSLAK
jgi:hypothetical protein